MRSHSSELIPGNAPCPSFTNTMTVDQTEDSHMRRSGKQAAKGFVRILALVLSSASLCAMPYASSVQTVAKTSCGITRALSQSFPANTAAGDLRSVVSDFDTNSFVHLTPPATLDQVRRRGAFRECFYHMIHPPASPLSLSLAF